MNSSISKNRKQLGVALRYISCRVKSELKAESAKNYLGYLWWLMEPALLILVFYFVFGVLFKRGGEGFASSLMIGVTAWLWFSGSVLRAMMSVRRESHLMLLVYMPKYIFPLASVLTHLVKQLLVILLILGLLTIIDSPSAYWLNIGLVFFVQFILILAISLVLAAIIPFVPDLAIIISTLMPMGMFISGVFFTLDQVPELYRPYFLLNPMAGLIDNYRNVLLHGSLPDFSYLWGVGAVSVVILICGFWMLHRFDRSYPRLAY